MGSGWRLTPGGLDDRTKRPAGSHQRAVSRLTMVIFGSVLEAPRHHARRIAATVAHIEVGAVAAGYGVSATAISAISVAFTTTVVFANTHSRALHIAGRASAVVPPDPGEGERRLDSTCHRAHLDPNHDRTAADEHKHGTGLPGPGRRPRLPQMVVSSVGALALEWRLLRASGRPSDRSASMREVTVRNRSYLLCLGVGQ
jgi:hypothetical protein